jgi:hypothetical protein
MAEKKAGKVIGFDKAKQQSNFKKQEEALNELKRWVNTVANTEEGLRFLQWLRKYSGFDMLSINIDSLATGTKPETFLFNEGKKVMYIAIRNMLSQENRNKVEQLDYN